MGGTLFLQFVRDIEHSKDSCLGGECWRKEGIGRAVRGGVALHPIQMVGFSFSRREGAVQTGCCSQAWGMRPANWAGAYTPMAHAVHGTKLCAASTSSSQSHSFV